MISFDKPFWIAGSEQRFTQFFESLDDKEVIAVVSHKSDLDGIVSAKVITSAVEAAILKLVDYTDLNEQLIETLRAEKVTKIIISDLNFKKKEHILQLESFAHVLIVDHHQFTEDFNSEKTVFMNAQGMCAAYLSYYLFSKKENLKEWDWAVACASLSDWAWKKNGLFLSEVFKKYGKIFVGSEEDVKKGVFWEFQYQLYLALVYYKNDLMQFYKAFPEKFGELGSLSKYIREVQNEVDRVLHKFDLEKKIIHERMVWEFKGIFPVRELIINMRSHECPEKTFVIFEKSGEIYKCSFRRQDEKEDVSLLARKLVEGFDGGDGGGHKAASGCSFPTRFLPEFLERLTTM